MGHRALAAEVGHGQDGSASRSLHQGLGRPRRRDERVGGDVERKPETVARSVREAPFQVAGVGERDGMDEEVELALERLLHFREDPVNTLV